MTTTDGDGAQGSEAGTCVSQGVKLASQDFQAQASSRIHTNSCSRILAWWLHIRPRERWRSVR